jgi:uncharacterized protein YyaL (SSP411 family)
MERVVLLAAALGCTASAAAPVATSAEANPAAPGLAPSSALVTKLAAALAAKGPDFRPNTRHLDARGRPLFTNRLILETSPYLLQHANNPVSWYTWGDEPFARAAREHKPVLLSVGYSTCHWCHVMERESFEDLEVARYLNESYVAIKVDREERPDIDGIYMAAVEMLTGNGGWPMTAVLTPDRQPFFGGTYFPRDRFLGVLQQLRRVHDKDPGRLAAAAKELTRAVQESAQPARPGSLPGPKAIRDAAEQLARSYDAVHGGFGGAPKFPTPVNLELLLRYHRRTGDAQALKMVVHTLESMAAGGIYDQLGGGFHRYSTDVQWLKPHFEKMLYDNAQLTLVYLEAWQITGRADFGRVVRETLDFILRDMMDHRGGFWSASDADSPGPDGEEVEGYYFTWTPREIEAVLGKQRGALVEADYGVNVRGDLDGRSILRQLSDVPADLREQLLAARSKRARPAIDRKIIPSWNGLVISAFARAGFALGEPRYTAGAARAAEFVFAHLGDKDRFLDDYAALAQGLIDLYEATRDPRWLTRAIALHRMLDLRFHDSTAGGYFLTPEGKQGLLAREKPAYDGVMPTGNSIAAMNLMRLSELTGDEQFHRRADEVMAAFASRLPAMPAMLAALDWSLDQPLEVVLVMPRGQCGMDLLEVLERAYLPNAVRAIARDGPDFEKHARVVPLLQGRHAQRGKATAYVCRKRVCDLPTSDTSTFANQLAKTAPLFPDRSPAPLPAASP